MKIGTFHEERMRPKRGAALWYGNMAICEMDMDFENIVSNGMAPFCSIRLKIIAFPRDMSQYCYHTIQFGRPS